MSRVALLRRPAGVEQEHPPGLFRRSFLVAFATRIGQRLREAVDATVDAVSDETGMALVPILASRDEAVQADLALGPELAQRSA